MDGRTGLVVGGLTAVAASVAVVTAVAFTNTAALQDSPGAAVTTGRVLVPAASPSTTTPTPASRPTAVDAPTPAPDVIAPDAIAPPAGVAEAPAPVIVRRADAPPAAGPLDAGTAPDVPAAADQLESVIATAAAAGSWDAVRAWASAHGWSAGRIEALVARLDRERAAEDDDASVMPVPVDVTTEERRFAEAESQRRLAAPESSSQGTAPGLSRSAGDLPGGERAQPQKPFHPPRPAHAGANVGHGNGAGPDAKKDQSRDSPDKRD